MKELQKSKSVHKPFGEGRCTACHDPHGTKNEKSLVAIVPQLCFKCHDPKSPRLAEVHRGFSLAEANCAACHDPHGSNGLHLMYSVSHEPYGAGNCKACHAPGSGKLVASQPELCLRCHGKLEDEMKDGHLHPAISGEKACTACHQPHTARFEKLLPAGKDQLCARCHSSETKSAAASAHAHPLRDGSRCTICHDPHVAAPVGDLTAAERRCGSCHGFDSKEKTHVSHPMGGEVKDPRTGRVLYCASCHAPHGSSFDYFLADDPNGRLCVTCHTEKIRKK
jgi:predicted CXXCH cytochrome family protein